MWKYHGREEEGPWKDACRRDTTIAGLREEDVTNRAERKKTVISQMMGQAWVKEGRDSWKADHVQSGGDSCTEWGRFMYRVGAIHVQSGGDSSTEWG